MLGRSIAVSQLSSLTPILPAVAGQRPGSVQELPPGHLGALAAGGGGDGVRSCQLGHGQERGSQAGEEQAAGPRGGYEL